MLIPKQTIIRDQKHRKWIASLPCLITGATDVQAAHIRRGNGGGIGMKPSDIYCVPLSVEQHRLQGEIGELKFWYPYGGYERVSVLAKRLYEISGNTELALEEIVKWKRSR